MNSFEHDYGYNLARDIEHIKHRLSKKESTILIYLPGFPEAHQAAYMEQGIDATYDDEKGYVTFKWRENGHKNKAEGEIDAY